MRNINRCKIIKVMAKQNSTVNRRDNNLLKASLILASAKIQTIPKQIKHILNDKKKLRLVTDHKIVT